MTGVRGEAVHAQERVVAACRKRGLTIATAESCTGGLIAARLTAVPGASAVFLGGAVCYANRIKTELLGVSHEVIAEHGAVSEACACAMAVGARERFRSDVAVSATGIAGPDGGTAAKPVGLVYIGVATAVGVRAERCQFLGSREEVRVNAVARALALLLLAVESPEAV